MNSAKMKTMYIGEGTCNKVSTLDILKLDCHQLEWVGKCFSIHDALEKISTLNPELIILDIEIFGAKGFEILNTFEIPPFKIIVISNNDRYALEAIKSGVDDYVLKSYNNKELKKAIVKIVKKVKLVNSSKAIERVRKKEIVISTYKGFYTIALDRIESIKSKPGNYCLIKFSDKTTDIVTKPLIYFESILPNNQFFRIHRSYLINLRKVDAFEHKKGVVKMKTGEVLDVAIRRRKNFITKTKIALKYPTF